MVITFSAKRRRLSYSLQFLNSAVSVNNNIVANAAGVVADVAVTHALRQRKEKVGSSPGQTIIERTRRSVHDIYKQLGKVYFRRAYRMKYVTFVRLGAMLHSYIIAASGKKGGTLRRYIPNGPISTKGRDVSHYLVLST